MSVNKFNSSLGTLTSIDIKAPTFVGDTIHVECEVVECRESRNRPGFGLVRTHNRIVKQDGTVVQVYQPGYILEDRVLRPAMVVVAKAGDKRSKEDKPPGEPAAGSCECG